MRWFDSLGMPNWASDSTFDRTGREPITSTWVSGLKIEEFILIFDELQKKLCSCSRKLDLNVDRKSICTGRQSIIKNLYVFRERSFRLGLSENNNWIKSFQFPFQYLWYSKGQFQNVEVFSIFKLESKHSTYSNCSILVSHMNIVRLSKEELNLSAVLLNGQSFRWVSLSLCQTAAERAWVIPPNRCIARCLCCSWWAFLLLENRLSANWLLQHRVIRRRQRSSNSTESLGGEWRISMQPRQGMHSNRQSNWKWRDLERIGRYEEEIGLLQ